MPLLYVVGNRGARASRLPDHRPAQAGDLLVTANGVAQLLFYLIVLVALAKPLGTFMARCTKAVPAGSIGRSAGSSA